jgi:Domain of unknown function (DUF5658)
LISGARTRMRERLAAARLRETKFLMSFNLASVNNRLLILLSIFVALNFFDAVTTLLAINAGPTFVELNPIASGLFHLDFAGFLVALTLKYMPMIPLAYATFLPGDSSKGITLRVVKVSALVALAAADIFYVAVVGSNSANLLSYFLGR